MGKFDTSLLPEAEKESIEKEVSKITKKNRNTNFIPNISVDRQVANANTENTFDGHFQATVSPVVENNG